MTDKKKKYEEFPVGDNLRVVEDFLPSPSEIAFDEPKTKVTLSLTKSSVDFFKQQARLNGTKYQRMIRILLDNYVNQHREHRQ
ncbi:MAG: CopG family transcriptional regulator [Myxococcota bacterium]|nr:CopG family transcriptional regulator [Myxococcota bacterium]